MYRKLSIIFLLCVAMLGKSIASAQEFNLFAKQKVVVADIRDLNDRKLSDGVKHMIRQGIIDACANSDNYEVYEVNIDDIKHQLAASGQSASFSNICKKIGSKADYIIFTNVKLSTSDLGAQNISIYITSSLYRIATASEMRSQYIESQPTSQSIVSSTLQLVSKLLGVNIAPQSQQIQNSYTQSNVSSQSSYQSFNSNYSSQNSSSQVFVENANCGLNMKMIRVDGGTFQMGATSEQGSDTASDEKPIHNVTLDTFYIAECEITQAQWQKIMGTTIYDQYDKAKSSWGTRGVGDSYPMYYVNWNEAQVFCQELSSITGRRYRLPTEAEWEYAARGGNKAAGTLFSGGGLIDAVAWYYGNSDSSTHPVKQKRANPLGLYDMSGNVWEWCSDWHDSYSSSSQSNPTGANSGWEKILRGGGWYSGADRCRVSYRAEYEPSNHFGDSGFRVVCLP